MGNDFNTHFACWGPWGRRGTEQLPRSIGRFFDQIQTGPILVTRQFRTPSQGLLNRLYATDLVSHQSQSGNDRGRPLICGVENLSEVARHTLPRSPSNDLACSRSINVSTRGAPSPSDSPCRWVGARVRTRITTLIDQYRRDLGRSEGHMLNAPKNIDRTQRFPLGEEWAYLARTSLVSKV
jgi:hypothetical protein